MAEHRFETTSIDEKKHASDCAFVCAILKQYPCAAYEGFKNAPAIIQADIEVVQMYLESRQAHRPNIGLLDQEKARMAAGNSFSQEGEACLAQLLGRYEYYTDLNLTATAALAMMKMERSGIFKQEMVPVELPVFD